MLTYMYNKHRITVRYQTISKYACGGYKKRWCKSDRRRGKEEKNMFCNYNEAPALGVLSQVMHLTACHAKDLFGNYNLKPWQAAILFVLNGAGELSQRELAAKINVTPSTITTAIQKMEKEGYIVRRADEKDQRILRLQVTEKGKDCIEHIKEVGEKMDALLFQGMNLEEKLLLKRLLIQVRDNLEKGKEWSL